jgi:hypothetical protein
VFQSRTTLKLDSSSEISQFGLTFTNFAEICAHTHDYEYLVGKMWFYCLSFLFLFCIVGVYNWFCVYIADVIGVITGISSEREYIRDGKVTKMVILELTDHRYVLEMQLFLEFNCHVKYLHVCKLVNFVVILLNSGKCECALFGDYVAELNKKMGKSSSGLPIAVIQFAKVKIFRGNVCFFINYSFLDMHLYA